MTTTGAPKVDAAPTWKTRLVRWFTDHTSSRTAEQIKREEYVLWAPASGRFSRWMVVLPVFIVQLCIGSLYSCELETMLAERAGAERVLAKRTTGVNLRRVNLQQPDGQGVGQPRPQHKRIHDRSRLLWPHDAAVRDVG